MYTNVSQRNILDMSEREYQTYRKNRIKRLQLRNLFIITSFAVIAALTIVLIAFASSSKASDNNQEWYLYATTVWMNEGDSIALVAAEYMDDIHYESVEEYTNVLIRTNHFPSSGCAVEAGYIVVPYYSTDFRMIEE